MLSDRVYRYVGADAIRKALPAESDRTQIQSARDVLEWIARTRQELSPDGMVVVTFVIALDGMLWINDRRSEHILCAAGQDVLSAGEMTFAVHRQKVEVSEVTNQSTGYCPEPESWRVVERALENAKLSHPAEFTTAYTFRRCEQCQMINLVKEGWFKCEVCGTVLPAGWNFG